MVPQLCCSDSPKKEATPVLGSSKIHYESKSNTYLSPFLKSPGNIAPKVIPVNSLRVALIQLTADGNNYTINRWCSLLFNQNKRENKESTVSWKYQFKKGTLMFHFSRDINISHLAQIVDRYLNGFENCGTVMITTSLV